MRIPIVCCLGIILIVGSPAAAQRIAPQSDATCGGPQSTTVNWSQFHFDPCHTGYNPYETILGLANVGNLVLDWELRIPGTNVMASPAVVSGVLYFGTEGDSGLHAVDARTGDMLWNQNSGYDWAGSPVVWTGVDLVRHVYRRVFVASGSDIRAVDAGTGQVLWEVTDPFGDIPFPEITLANGAVYVASYHMGMTHFGHLYALDASTGAVLWKLNMQDWNFSTPAVANGLVYVRCDERSLCALDAGTGEILWEFTSAVGDILSPPAVAGDLVYFCASNLTLTYVYALKAATGALVWQRPIGTLSSTQDSSTSTPAVANGVVYIGLGNNSPERGELYAVNANTGASLWTYRVAGRIDSSPAVANGVVYFGSEDWNVYALDASTGALLWKYTTENVVVSSPAVVNGVLYVGSFDSMYAFHLPGQ